MDPLVTETVVSRLQLAAVHDRTTFPDLGRKIMRHVDTTLKSLRGAGVEFGRCVVVYWDHEGDSPLIDTPDGVEIDVGWEVDPAFADPHHGVATAHTPGGPVATTVHVGPYDSLYLAHRAVRDWMKKNGRRRAGPSWEVYDHPREGSPPRTDVFYLIG